MLCLHHAGPAVAGLDGHRYCAATPTTASHSTVGDGLGTAAEYDETWTFNSLSEPASKTAYVRSANAFASTGYGYSSSQPTALTSASTTGAVTSNASFTYNADGEQATRSTTAGNQTLAWNHGGDLTGVTASSGGAAVASYVYGADGSLFSQTEGTKTTAASPGVVETCSRKQATPWLREDWPESQPSTAQCRRQRCVAQRPSATGCAWKRSRPTSPTAIP